MSSLFIILYLGFFLLILYKVSRNHLPELPRYMLPFAFLIKIGYALLFVYIYTYHYGDGELSEDAGYFFQDSKILYEVFFQSPKDFFTLFFSINPNPELVQQYLSETMRWNTPENSLINSSQNVVRVNTLLQFISGGVVFVHFIILSFASFIGGLDLYQWLKKKSNLPPIVLLILLTLMPNIAFWGSSIIKEPLMILGLCIALRGFFDNISTKKRAWRIVLGSILTLSFKPYIFICLLVALVFYFIFSRLFKKQWVNILVFGVFGFGVLLGSGFSAKVTQVISQKQKDFLNVRDGGLYVEANETHYYYIKVEDLDCFSISEDNKIATLEKPVDAFYLLKNESYERFPIKLDEVGESYPIYLNMKGAKSKIKVTLINNDFWQLVKNAPEAIFNSFLQPIPNKDNSKIEYISFIENVFFVLLLISLLFFPKSIANQDKIIVITLSVFVLSVALIVGWITPVAGAIIRYIVPAKIVVIVIFALKFDFDKARNRLSKQQQ